KQAVLEWGWRIPFLLGIVAAPAGMLIRRRLEETLTERQPGETKPRGALREALTTHLKLTVLGTFAELGGSVSVYITAFFLPSHAVRTLHLSSAASVALGVSYLIVIF